MVSCLLVNAESATEVMGNAAQFIRSLAKVSFAVRDTSHIVSDEDEGKMKLYVPESQYKARIFNSKRNTL